VAGRNAWRSFNGRAVQRLRAPIVLTGPWWNRSPASARGAHMQEFERIKVLFVAGFAPIVRDRVASGKLYGETLNISLKKEQGGNGINSGYGLGWEISAIEGRSLIYHGGSTGTCSSVVILDTAKKIAAAIVINIDLTLIDEYRYQTLLNIMNNILHLAADEQATNYGIPIIKDPSMNDFILDKSLQPKYTGEYISLAGGIWMFDGADMTVRENSDGELEALIFRGQQVIFRFDLDFVNRSSAISRNIFMCRFTIRGFATTGGPIGVRRFRLEQDSRLVHG